MNNNRMVLVFIKERDIEYIAVADSRTIKEWEDDGLVVIERQALIGDYSRWPTNRLMIPE